MKLNIETGSSPLVLAQPHGGIEVPPEIFARLNPLGQALDDTDWHIHRLYDGLLDDATVVSMPMHRYVIDANRDPADQSLYPGQNTTSLCPTTTFDGEPIYLPGEEPSTHEIQQRQKLYHQPYHDALAEQLRRVHHKHGFVILYDCHSIRSQVPYLFEGQLPDFNIGTNSGLACGPQYESSVVNTCAQADGYTHVVNGRFKGGWTTRHYGKPEQGYHALQMELAQHRYMREQRPWDYDNRKAKSLRPILQGFLVALLAIGKTG